MRRRQTKQPLDAERVAQTLHDLVDPHVLEAPEFGDLLPLTQLDPADVERRMQTLTPGERRYYIGAIPG